MAFYYQKLNSPVGDIHIVTDGEYLCILAIDNHWLKLKSNFTDLQEGEHSILTATKQQLDEYFLGDRKVFELPIRLAGTDFQQDAWQALLKIPYGQTRSYAQQAASIGRPKAVRAVGRANGMNPISIIVPCHRVIGSSGKLTGFASGLDNKQYLLDLEHG